MAGEFVAEIQKSPDLVEEFYQKAFEGLDEREGKPGVRRVKADGFYLLVDDELQEFFNKSIENRLLQGRSDIDTVKKVLNHLGRYEYKNGPYGTGDAFVPRR